MTPSCHAVGGTVLVVDSEPQCLRSTSEVLQKSGYDTVACEHGERALELMDRVNVDAVVSDLDEALPDGRRFVSLASRAHRGKPIVATTRHHDLPTVWKLLDGGIPGAVLPKPVEPEQLLGALGSLLAHRVHVAAQDARQLTEGLVRSLALRDVETASHARRVALWTRRLATEMAVPSRDLFWYELGGLLHDVGKIGVPDAILHKPDTLTEAEWRVMKDHPRAGHELLLRFPSLERARAIVLHHHERWDGAGYPSGLARDEIPLAARVFALADTYDAMTAHRAYRGAMTPDLARTLIVAERGAQFDPDVVDAFVAIDPTEWWEVHRDAPDVPDAPTSTTSMASSSVEITSH